MVDFSRMTDFIDDFMINMYFSDLESFEKEYQNEIKSLRFKVNQVSYSSEKKVLENYTKQLEVKEKEFFYSIACKMNEIRKCSISGLVYTLNPFATIFNENFMNYIFETENEDRNLISFLSLD
jgi:hypothetical protein